MGVVGDHGGGPTSAGAMLWNRGSEYSGVGTVKVPKRGSSLQAKIKDAMLNGTGSYRDIDNALSAGGHDGNGSPQSALVNSGSSLFMNDPPRPYGGSGDSGGSHHTYVGRPDKPVNYYEAPLAQLHGFNRTTAYQEALANTAYRREMADMRKAGLNPSVIYGSHNSSGASANILPRDDFAYVGYGGSGGSGGYGGGRRYRGGNSGKYLFSGGAYYGIMAAVGTIAAVATKNVGAGMAAAGLTGTALKALNGSFKK